MTDEKEEGKLSIEEVLFTEGKYVGPTVGVSMLPMLKTGRDSVVIRPKRQRLRELDVALFKRGKEYILHRVVAVKEGGYLIRGDNCYGDEAVREEEVLGVLTEFFRSEKHVLCTDKRYLRYARRRVATYPARRFFMRVKRKVKEAAKRFLKRKNENTDGEKK